MSTSTREITTVIAEYVWLDYTKKYRSKVRTLTFDSAKIKDDDALYNPGLYPEWNYDGSSTNDVTPCIENNHNTECILQPVHIYKNPFAPVGICDYTCYAYHVVVWCINFVKDNDTTCPGLKTLGDTSNTCGGNIYILDEHNNMISRDVYWKERDAPMFGFEQEFYIIDNYTNYPVGFKKYYQFNLFKYIYSWMYHSLTKYNTWGEYIWSFNDNKYMQPINGGQGPYYCGNGGDGTMRRFMDNTYAMLRKMGLKISGMNYEVAPGQAEFQICDYGIDACDGLHMLRWALIRSAEQYDYTISFEPVVIPGGVYNNTGCHVNFSTQKMRETGGMTHINRFITELGKLELYMLQPTNYIKMIFEQLFGKNNCARLSGKLETSMWHNFTYGIGTRHTSIRIPNSVYKDGCGYLEDRRPAGNVEPYKIANYYYDLLDRIKLKPE